MDKYLRSYHSHTTKVYFFFVLLTAMIAAAQAVPHENSIQTLAVYLLAIGTAAGGSMVGIDLLQRLIADGLSLVGKWGVALLLVIVPCFFIFGIGLLLNQSNELLLSGLGIFLFLLFLPYLAEFYKTHSGAS